MGKPYFVWLMTVVLISYTKQLLCVIYGLNYLDSKVLFTNG